MVPAPLTYYGAPYPITASLRGLVRFKATYPDFAAIIRLLDIKAWSQVAQAAWTMCRTQPWLDAHALICCAVCSFIADDFTTAEDILAIVSTRHGNHFRDANILERHMHHLECLRRLGKDAIGAEQWARAAMHFNMALVIIGDDQYGARGGRLRATFLRYHALASFNEAVGQNRGLSDFHRVLSSVDTSLDLDSSSWKCYHIRGCIRTVSSDVLAIKDYWDALRLLPAGDSDSRAVLAHDIECYVTRLKIVRDEPFHHILSDMTACTLSERMYGLEHYLLGRVRSALHYLPAAVTDFKQVLCDRSVSQQLASATHNAIKACYREALSVDPDASARTIDRAFRRMSLVYHTDKNLHMERSWFHLINEARDALKEDTQ